MIRLNASLSRKLPVAGVEFSSQSVSAGLEVEVSDTADGTEIAGKLRNLYALLDRSITEQIETTSAGSPPAASAPKPPFLSERDARGGVDGNRGNGNGRRNGHASAAQIKALFGISKAKGMDRNGLLQLLKAEYDVERPDDLSVKEASDLIGKLQREGVRR